MAANNTAILTAIEECALGTIGSSETVPASTLIRNAHNPDEVGAPMRAKLNARFEATIVGEKDSGLMPRMSDRASVEYSILVRCTYTAGFELDDDGRRDARAEALRVTRLVRNALTHAGNLTQTSGAVATGIASGALIKSASRVVSEDHKKRLIVTEITATAIVTASRP